MVHDTSFVVQQTAREIGLLQDTTMATVENVRVGNLLTEDMLRTIMQAKENVSSLREDSELLARIWHVLRIIFSRNTATWFTILAFTMTTVATASCCFGLRHGYYLMIVYREFRLHQGTNPCCADVSIVQSVAIALVVVFVPFHDLAVVAASHSRATLCILGAIAISGAMLHAGLRHQLFCALRFRSRPQPTPLAAVNLPPTQKWVPITTVKKPLLTQQSRHQDPHRSRRAQTTPPRL